MFRRKGSDTKKSEKEGSKASTSDKDSSVSSGSGGIMNSMKAAMYSGRAAEAPEMKTKKDGSAHPHAGSDARVNSLLIIICTGN